MRIGEYAARLHLEDGPMVELVGTSDRRLPMVSINPDERLIVVKHPSGKHYSGQGQSWRYHPVEWALYRLEDFHTFAAGETTRAERLMRWGLHDNGIDR